MFAGMLTHLTRVARLMRLMRLTRILTASVHFTRRHLFY